MTSERGLDCPSCGAGRLNILETRRRDGRLVRRRQCGTCGYRFNTIEIPVDEHDKLLRGVNAALIETLQGLKQITDKLRSSTSG